MKTKRVIGILCLLTTLVMTMANTAMAEQVSPEKDITNLASIATTKNLESEKYFVSDVMNFEEMLQVMLANGCIEKNELLRIADEHARTTKTASAATYRVLSVNVAVNDAYCPKIDFYCETTEQGNGFTIKNMYSVGLNRNSNGMTKQYDGYIHAYIRGGNSIEYWMYGSFYNTGTTSIASRTNGSTILNQMYSITYSASNTATSNKYANCSNHETKLFM